MLETFDKIVFFKLCLKILIAVQWADVIILV